MNAMKTMPSNNSADTRRRGSRKPRFSPDTVLFNETQTGKMLGLSRWTVAGMLNRFEMKFVPRGQRGRLVPLTEINRWIKERLVSNPEEWRRALDGRRKS